MRKTMIISLMALLSVMLVFGFADARITTTACVDCHTMHNSQNGNPVATDDNGDLTTTPHGNLLKSTCLGCHRGDTPSDGSAVIPLVYSTTAPANLFTNTYAGGSFSWVSTQGDVYGHNVKGFSSADDCDGATPCTMYPPPGYGGSIVTWTSTQQLTCAGTYGCHGDRTNDSDSSGVTDDYEATRGAHHANDTTINGTTVGTSFRFLLGVVGTEMNAAPNKWAYNMTPSIHNEYKGLTTPAANVTDDSPGAGGSISGLCAECHGKFHSQPDRATATATASPWLRHPTDILLNTGGEVTDYNTPLGTYNIKAPVARQNPPTTPSTSVDTVTETSDIVMCLSCHVAHGSDQPDLLRFAYGDSMTIAGGSCLTCHTAKP
jgi:hypothetical protein